VAHKMCTLQMVSTRSHGIMYEDALVAYCHQRTSEAMEMILAILGCVTQVPITLALQQSISKKRDLKDPYHSTKCQCDVGVSRDPYHSIKYSHTL
jgi:hypothetical protein